MLGWSRASRRCRQHGACRPPARAVPDQRRCPWSRAGTGNAASAPGWARPRPPPAPRGAQGAPRGPQEAAVEERAAALTSHVSPKEGSKGRTPRSRERSRKPSFCGNCCRLLWAAFKQLLLQPRGLRLMEADYRCRGAGRGRAAPGGASAALHPQEGAGHREQRGRGAGKDLLHPQQCPQHPQHPLGRWGEQILGSLQPISGGTAGRRASPRLCSPLSSVPPRILEADPNHAEIHH